MSAKPDPADDADLNLIVWEEFWEALRRGGDVRTWLVDHPDARASAAELQVLADLHDTGRLLLEDSCGGGDAITTPEAAPGLPRGTVVGHWVLGDVLGGGGMGVVYRARHPVLQRDGVIKMLPRRLAADPDAVDRFLRSMRLLANADPHPHLAAAYDAGEHDGHYYLAMEYVAGPNLDEVVRRDGPLPVERTGAVLRQAAAGLGHLADCGIVHRDVKPANLVLTADGTVKIIDLGLARQLPPAAAADDGHTAADVVLGTADYMAPEQARDPRRADHRSDLYALGGTAYFLLTGRPPFPDGGRGDKLDAHAHTSPVPIRRRRADVPAWLEAVLLRLLAKRPEARFADARALIDALDRGPADPSSTPPRWRRWVIGAVGAAAVAAALVVIVLRYRATDQGTVTLTVNEPRGNRVVVEVRVEPEQPAPAPTDPERRAAQRVLERGGKLVLYQKPFRVAAAAELPAGPISIQNIDLSGKPVGDDELAELADLRQLQGLLLGGTAVTDRGAAHLERLISLKWLYLSRTKFTDAGLRRLRPLRRLENLDVAGTGVTDAGLAVLPAFASLRWLRLEDTGVSDAGLERLRPLAELRHLDLQGTGVTDRGLGHLAGLGRLERLLLARTAVTADGARAFAAERPGCKVQR